MRTISEFKTHFCQLEANVTFSTTWRNKVNVRDLIKFLASE